MRKNKGITLIALVITIIVLLILAGVSISMLTGENGILEKAKLAKEKNDIATEDEQLKLAYNTAMTKNAENGELYVDTESLQKELDNLVAGAVAKESEENEGKIDVTFPSGNKYTVEGRKKEITTKTISELVNGDYVYYIDKMNEKRLCRVLYDSTSSFGVQIITASSVGEVSIGDASDFSASVESYNNAISTLNQKATEEYLNEKYVTQARCVGTSPLNPSSEGSENYQTLTPDLRINIRETDYNYDKDWEQMKKLGINSIGNDYWLGSRYFGYTGETASYSR